MMYLKTRKEAQDLGERKFHTGEPCMNGHLTYRYTQSGSCAHCVNGVPKLSNEAREVNETYMKMQQKSMMEYSAKFNEAQLLVKQAKRDLAEAKFQNDKWVTIRMFEIEQAELAAATEADKMIKGMRKIDMVCKKQHLSILSDTAVALARERHPAITVGDVFISPRLAPHGSDMRNCEINCHPDDIVVLTQLSNQLLMSEQ